jgi:hypothetical protein
MEKPYFSILNNLGAWPSHGQSDQVNDDHVMYISPVRFDPKAFIKTQNRETIILLRFLKP